MNAELTAENRPACMPSNLVSSLSSGNCATHKDEGRVQVLVTLFRIASVKLIGLLAVDGKEVCAGVVGPQRIEELFENELETVRRVREALGLGIAAVELVHHFGSSWTRIGSFTGDV